MICGFNSNSKSGNGGVEKLKDRGEIIINGDGWATFPDLDHFNSDHLLSVLTLKDKSIEDDGFGLWDPKRTNKSSSSTLNPQFTSFNEQNMAEMPSLVPLRQLEALFNLTQLLFGLSKSNVVNFTFRDLQFGKHPHSFKKSGFKLLNTDSTRRLDFYEIFESLVNDIVSQGGLEVALTMYKNPILPMVRQKCLDLISNVTTVPVVAQRLLVEQPWFLDHLLIMIRDGELVSDKIPALSVLIRLLKVILTQRITTAYLKLVDMQYIDFIVDIFDDNRYRKDIEYALPLFVKFEFMAMQSLTVILGDKEYHTLWSEKAKTRLLNYCMIVLLKATGDFENLVDMKNSSYNHIKYAEENATKHSLAHTIMTITELLRYDPNMHSFYKNHSHFKKLVVNLFKKYGAKSVFIELDPGISYAINHLIHVLYIQGINKSSSIYNNESKSNTILPGSTTASSSSTSSLNLGRKCSNPGCDNEETKYKPFKPCPKCRVAAYCSSNCRTANLTTHLNTECQGNKKETNEFSNKQHYHQMSSSASSLQSQNAMITSNNALSAQLYANKVSRRASDNFFKMSNPDESAEGAPILLKNNNNVNKLPKYKSNLESNAKNVAELPDLSNQFFQHRRSSFNARLAVDGSGGNSETSSTRHKLIAQKSTEDNISRHHFIKNRSSFANDLSKQQKGAIKMTSTEMETSNRLALSRPLKTSTAVCLIDLPNRSNDPLRKSSKVKKGKSQDDMESNSGVSQYYFNTIGSQDELENEPESLTKQSSSSKLRYSKNNSNLFYKSPANNNNNGNSAHYYEPENIRASEPETLEQPEYHYAEEELQEFITHLCSSEDSDKENDYDEYDSEKVKTSTTSSSKTEEDEIEVKRFERSSSNRRSITSMNAYSLSKTNSLKKRRSAIDNMNRVESSEDDEDESAKIRVIKEYEKSVDFVRNASSLKVMNLHGTKNSKPDEENTEDEEEDDDEADDVLLNPHYIKDSLCLNSNRRESQSGPIHLNSDLTLKSNNSTSPMYFTNRHMPNIVINNSIHSADFVHRRDDEILTQDSTVTAQAQLDVYKVKSGTKINQELINNEMNMFKRNVRQEVEAEPYHPVTNPFKVPIVPPLRKDKQIKANKMKPQSSYNELKIFPECEQKPVDTTKQSLSSSIITDASKLSNQPISSTPIRDDSPNTLQSKRKQLFTADMTINAVPSQKATTQYVIKKPKVTEKLDENGIEESNNLPKVDLAKRANQNSSITKMASPLNLSTLAALENVASSANLVSVAQVELPKQVIKSELKKKCSIQ